MFYLVVNPPAAAIKLYSQCFLCYLLGMWKGYGRGLKSLFSLRDCLNIQLSCYKTHCLGCNSFVLQYTNLSVIRSGVTCHLLHNNAAVMDVCHTELVITGTRRTKLDPWDFMIRRRHGSVYTPAQSDQDIFCSLFSRSSIIRTFK